MVKPWIGPVLTDGIQGNPVFVPIQDLTAPITILPKP